MKLSEIMRIEDEKRKNEEALCALEAKMKKKIPKGIAKELLEKMDMSEINGFGLFGWEGGSQTMEAVRESFKRYCGFISQKDKKEGRILTDYLQNSSTVFEYVDPYYNKDGKISELALIRYYYDADENQPSARVIDLGMSKELFIYIPKDSSRKDEWF